MRAREAIKQYVSCIQAAKVNPPPEFEIGDVVFEKVKKGQRRHKFDFKWAGPFKVIGKD